uniref:Uncharacterized protein n=1 Tax=Cucumis sativus TaxID=3659 RepID=A0A0A0KCR5_CUCSA
MDNDISKKGQIFSNLHNYTMTNRMTDYAKCQNRWVGYYNLQEETASSPSSKWVSARNNKSTDTLIQFWPFHLECAAKPISWNFMRLRMKTRKERKEVKTRAHKKHIIVGNSLGVKLAAT